MDVLRLRIARVVSRIVRWAVVETAGADEDPYPTQRVKYLGKEANSQAWYPYGFNAHAPRGTLSMLFAIGGDTGAAVHMPGSPQDRIKVAPGEVVMYHPESGAAVHMQDDGSIDIISDIDITVNGGATVNVVATDIALAGDVAVTGDVVVTGALSVTGAADFAAAVLVDSVDGGADVDLADHEHDMSGFGVPTGGPEDPP